MIDTAKLTAAVETLQLYCEQVRHVMVAKGYPEARVIVDVEAGGNSWHDQYAIKVYDDFAGRTAHEMFGIREFEKALAYAESRPPRATAADIAATLGISPDGRVIVDNDATGVLLIEPTADPDRAKQLYDAIIGRPLVGG